MYAGVAVPSTTSLQLAVPLPILFGSREEL